jgi:ABC-2 type transport system permease protein
LYRQPATSALATLAVWLFFAVFWNIITQIVAQAVRPIEYGFPEEQLRQIQMQLFLSRLSPNTLYTEVLLAILNPAQRALGPVLVTQLEGAIMGTPLPWFDSLLLAWPQLVGMIATVILLFAWAYVNFQRQEVRA